MSKKISAAILLTLFMFSLFSVPVFALDEKPDPRDRPLRCKDPAPTHMTIEEATEYERVVGDRSEFAETAEADVSFVPGAPASQSVLVGPSGLFNGIFAGNTKYDYQKNGTCHRMIEEGIDPLTGIRYVHVTWMVLKVDIITDPSRAIHYDCYNPVAGAWCVPTDPYGGAVITSLVPPERGGYTCLDVNSEGNAVVFHHSAVEGAGNFPLVARFGAPCMSMFTSSPSPVNLPGEENIWLRGEVGHSALENGDIYHVGAQDSGPTGAAHNSYWRYVYTGGAYVWEGPVVMGTTMTLSHLLLADGERVIFAYAVPRTLVAPNQYNNDLGYYESMTAGADWITNNGPGDWDTGAGYNCTDYVDSDPHRVYIDLTGGFDSEGRLHLIYNNPGYDDEAGTISIGPCALLHWAEKNPAFDFNRDLEADRNANAFVSPGPGNGFVGGSDVNFSTVARAMWGTPGMGDPNCGTSGAWCRYISKMCMAFGDGSTLCYEGTGDQTPNLDHLYVTYTQFGSPDPLDKEDCSAADQQNGNIWLSISNDKGISFAAGMCITTVDEFGDIPGPVGGTPTRTPDCDATTGDPADRCQSEHWSSCAEFVTDTLHVFYVGDLDAGGIAQGQGNWAINDVMYLRVTGTGGGKQLFSFAEDKVLCAVIAPVLGVAITSDPNCEYYADDNELINWEELSIDNDGNAPLIFSGDITYSSGADWLFLPEGQIISETTIGKGSATEKYDVEMDGSGLENGLYQAQINIHHNARTPYAPDPYVLEINFFRADSFICGRGVVVTTPCVALEVSNTESFGRENGLGGMFYYVECSAGCDPDDDSLFNPIFDGSLAIVNKTLTDDVDTIVYRDIFSNQTKSNPGFRGLEYPRVFFNAATNESVVEANQCTVDSTIGITVRYLFPQDPDTCEFVRIKFKVYPRDGGGQDLIIGTAVDIDCPGGGANGIGSDNFGGVVEDYNLVYQQGTDTLRPGGPGTFEFYRITNRYVAGITAITCNPVKRMAVGSNYDDVYPVSGFRDSYLFDQMDATGHEIWADSADDIHAIMAIEDITLAEGDVHVYQFAVVTSVAGGTGVQIGDMPAPITDLMETVKKAWKKGFGWCTPWWWMYGETLLDGGDGEIGFRATGTHEDGLSSECCGCDFSYEIDPVPASGTVTLIDNGDCTGHIEFVGVSEGTYTLTLIVADKCAAQTDEVVVVIESIPQTCNCGFWGDVTNDGQVNPLDVVFMVQTVYNTNPMLIEPDGFNCPNPVGDVTCDNQVNPVDVVFYVQTVYNTNPMLCPDPCTQ